MTAPPHSSLPTPHFPLAYIAGQFPLRSETFVWREVRELRRRGWTVHTFGLYAPDEETPAELMELRESTRLVYGDTPHWREMAKHPFAVTRSGFDALKVGEPLSGRGRAKLMVQAGAGAELGRELRRLGVKHVHAHFAHAPTSIAMYAARAAGLPFSFTGHANDLFQRRQALRMKLKRAAFVSCISNWHRELYRRLVPRDESAYPVIRCGIDANTFTPHPHELGERPHIVSVCRLVEKKGIDLLIRAVARLRQLRIDLDVTIAGDGPLKAKYQEMTRELSVKDRVTFLGAIDSQQVVELLAKADCFVLPCRVDSRGDRDGIPVVLMEAMASGLPVISGDLPAIRELIVDGQSGVLVKPNDVDALAAAIAPICKDSALSRRFGEKGRERVLAEFALTRNVDLLESSFLAATRR